MAAIGFSLTGKLQTAASICAMLTFAFCLASGVALAQDMEKLEAQLPQNAPPPMKLIPQDEWTRLNNMRSPGDRTRASIEMAESHLARALEATNGGLFDHAAREMGGYQALFEDALKYLAAMDSSRGRVRDLYKRLELALREHAPRIETIRRITPLEYSVHIKGVLEYTKEARTRALDSFYGNTVMREQSLPPSSKAYDDRNQHPASHSSNTQDKQP